ncbi:hypothetical protein D3C79_1088380 [compost metagenome]
MLTLTPLGVAREYSCKGCLPTGSALSWVGPATGRLMLANWPPEAASLRQTLGGAYGGLLMLGSP